MTKSELTMQAAIQALATAGFSPDGATFSSEYRMPTKASPLLGVSGGELAKFGGRQRFAREGTDLRATVGARTTCLYRHHPGAEYPVEVLANIQTKNVDEIRQALQQVIQT